MARIPKGARVSFNDATTGEVVDAKVVEHELTSVGHKYRVRRFDNDKRVWLREKDMVSS